MSSSNPTFRSATSRDAGAPCQHCREEIRLGDEISACADCGAVCHASCWKKYDGCGSYDCAPARRKTGETIEPTLRISADELAAAVPLQPVRRGLANVHLSSDSFLQTGTNRMAIVSLVVALAGVIFFGIITGLVAVVLASLALGKIHASHQRGTAFALAGILLGIVDIVGWALFLSLSLTRPGPELNLERFEPDSAAMQNLAPHIKRAMEANVVIETKQGWGGLGHGMGSGVIVQIDDGNALIVTNRHVVDPNFADAKSSGAGAAGELNSLQVTLFGQPPQVGKVVWIAPDGIDFAFVQTHIPKGRFKAAPWQRGKQLAVGEEVFAIGNPHGLGWTHTKGAISQLRQQTRGNHRIRIIQTSAAINPGNSGGGLYDKNGILIGINTWTNDKRVSEGLGFAINLDSLLDLQPPLNRKTDLKTTQE